MLNVINILSAHFNFEQLNLIKLNQKMVKKQNNNNTNKCSEFTITLFD